MYIYMCINRYTCIHCMYISCICIHIRAYAYTQNINKYMHICIYICIFMYIHINTYMHTCMYICMYIYTCTSSYLHRLKHKKTHARNTVHL